MSSQWRPSTAQAVRKDAFVCSPRSTPTSARPTPRPDATSISTDLEYFFLAGKPRQSARAAERWAAPPAPPATPPARTHLRRDDEELPPRPATLLPSDTRRRAPAGGVALYDFSGRRAPPHAEARDVRASLAASQRGSALAEAARELVGRAPLDVFPSRLSPQRAAAESAGRGEGGEAGGEEAEGGEAEGGASAARLARAAAMRGVVPPQHNLARKDRGHCGLAGPCARAAVGGIPAATPAESYHSEIVRFSVQLLEKLDAPLRQSADGTPSAESCYACMRVLQEVLPLLGPLEPVMTKVFHALELCIFSPTQLATKEPASEPAAWRTPRGGAVGEVRAGREVYMRTPFFVLVGQLEALTHSLRLQRDKARDEVARNGIEIKSLDDQLSTVKAHLAQKNATIEKLMREHTSLSEQLATAKAAAEREAKKLEVLQAEAVDFTRVFLRNTQTLEETIDELRFENAQLQSAALERGYTPQDIDKLALQAQEQVTGDPVIGPWRSAQG
ncbi:hypothetical protein AB1Y20_006903 [Prymnesium parvum]|uniref:Uncharacterized protein n=1 Tax=Prymnesium parvum TaxID=97485 RepID=A0AB34IZN6_PRYPA